MTSLNSKIPQNYYSNNYHIQSTDSSVTDALVSHCNLRALDYFALVYYCNEMTKPKQITQESSLKSETVICTALGMLPGSFFTLSIPVLQLCKDFPCAMLPQMKNNCPFLFVCLFEWTFLNQENCPILTVEDIILCGF